MLLFNDNAFLKDTMKGHLEALNPLMLMIYTKHLTILPWVSRFFLMRLSHLRYF